MTDLSFIATGWIGTAVAVSVYALSLRRRTRRVTHRRPEAGSR